jgi:hypothetical protein
MTLDLDRVADGWRESSWRPHQNPSSLGSEEADRAGIERARIVGLMKLRLSKHLPGRQGEYGGVKARRILLICRRARAMLCCQRGVGGERNRATADGVDEDAGRGAARGSRGAVFRRDRRHHRRRRVHTAQLVLATARGTRAAFVAPRPEAGDRGWLSRRLPMDRRDLQLAGPGSRSASSKSKRDMAAPVRQLPSRSGPKRSGP